MKEFYDKYYEGVFYNPTQGNEFKIIATLYIDNNGNATISSLQSIINDNQRQNGKIDFVFGYISHNSTSEYFSIKLFNLHQSYVSLSKLNKYKYISSDLYISKGFDNEICDCREYNSLMLSSQEINDWITITGFDFNLKTNKVFEISHFYKQPESVKLFENDYYKINLFFRANTSQPIKRNSSISETIFIIIDTKQYRTEKELLRLQKTIDWLFSIILDTLIISNKVEIRNKNGITYKKIIRDKKSSNNSFRSSVDFEKFIKSSKNIFENWFFKQERLELFIKNFFSVYGRKGVLIENQFLSYVSVLENFHKNNILKKANLNKRLKDIIENSKIFENIENINIYVDTLVKTRNYHTHLDEKHYSLSLSKEGFMNVNRILEYLIREILLRELNLEPTECKFCNYEIQTN